MKDDGSVVEKRLQNMKKFYLKASELIDGLPDIYILLVLQSVLVSLIASLSGRDISLDTAKEFILSLGGVVGAGFTFRLIAQQGSKLINAVWPGVGSAVSSGIAAAGTAAIGRSAIMYYIDGRDLEEAKAKFEEARKEKTRQKKVLI